MVTIFIRVVPSNVILTYPTLYRTMVDLNKHPFAITRPTLLRVILLQSMEDEFEITLRL